MSDRHVRAVDDGWAVEKPHASRASAVAAVQAEAITRAVEIVANDGGGEVIVHDRDGEVVRRRHVERDADAAAIGTALAVEVTGEKGAEIAGAAADAVREDAATVGDDARTTAKRVAGEARHGADRAAASAAAAADEVQSQAREVRAGEKSPGAAARDVSAVAQTAGGQVADQAARTGRQIAGEARGLGRRASSVVDARAQVAGEHLVDATDRAAREGARARRELDSVADRTSRAIHAATEAAASPFDRLAATLNPVRITGRIVDALATGGLRLVGLGVAEGADRADRGARRLTDR